MKEVVITVIKSPFNTYGYSLRHNQEAGFKGVIGYDWAWYRSKKYAQEQAERLMIEWNTPKTSKL